MTLKEINENYDELVEDMNGLKGLRDSLFTFYDVLNKPIPDNMVKLVQDAVKQSKEYRDLREGFVNRVNNFEAKLTYAGYSPKVSQAVVKEFNDFLKKN